MYIPLKMNILPSLVLGLCLACNAYAYAQSSKSDAAAIAKAQTGGKVLQVKQKKAGHYRVKVLMPNGQMRHIVVGKPEPASKK
jgi:predicted aspartyl protease